MNKQRKNTKQEFTIISHGVRSKLKLSMTEYAVADIIYRLSINGKSFLGWCFASKSVLAVKLGLTKRTIINLVETLLKKKIIEKHKGKPRYLRSSEIWINAISQNGENITPVMKGLHLQSGEDITLSGERITPDNGERITPPSEKDINKTKDKESMFDQFWNLYDKKFNRIRCYKKFMSLSLEVIDQIFVNVPLYVESTPNKKYRKHPITYLDNKSWEDEIILNGNNGKNKSNGGASSKQLASISTRRQQRQQGQSL